MSTSHRSTRADPEQWWKTGIIDIKPGAIGIRGYPIEQLIGRLSYAQMVWLMLRGEIPSRKQAGLLEAALVAAVDHGPQAPSIAVARMGITCGIDINNAMASAVNVLGDVHGGAGQQCMELYQAVAGRVEQSDMSFEEAVRETLDRYRGSVSKIVPGFGHRFHPVDPRSIRLLELLDAARDEGVISGKHVAIARAMEASLTQLVGTKLPMNIDGATAAVYCELGFPAAIGRGLFILSRSVGVLAHAYEQSTLSERIKGPMPPDIAYSYVGPSRRDFDGAS